MNEENCALKLVDEIILNRDCFLIQHELTGFCNRDGECLLRGTDYDFKYNSLSVRTISVTPESAVDPDV